MPLASLPSRCALGGLAAPARLDPYWDAPVWDTCTHAVWLSRSRAERMTSAGVVRPQRGDLDLSVEEAMAALAFGPGRARVLALLAAVAMFRTLTVQQLAAITGHPGQAAVDSRDRRLAWTAGLVQRRTFMSGMPGARLPGLVRLSNETDLSLLGSMLAYRDLVGVTAGQPWWWGSQFDRHNVIGAELLVRVAEYTPIPLVLGEQVCRFAAMVPGSVSGSVRCADGAMVRADGMRVAVEVTTSVTSNVRDKAERWARLLEHPGAANLSVLWLDVSHPDRPAPGRVGRPKLVELVGDAATTVSARLARVPERMLVVRYDDWFPARHTASGDFLQLRVWRPTGPAGRRWEQMSCLDPDGLAPARQVPESTSVLGNCAALYGIPHWQRADLAASHRRSPGLLDRLVLASGGFAREPHRPRTRWHRPPQWPSS